MVQQVSLMMFSWNMVDYPMSEQVEGTILRCSYSFGLFVGLLLHAKKLGTKVLGPGLDNCFLNVWVECYGGAGG